MTEDSLSQDQKDRAVNALARHLKPRDEVQFFDPYLSAIGPEGRYKRFVGGYKVWPEEVPEHAPDLRIMTIGNSTSLWPAYGWSAEMAEAMDRPDRRIELWHGAGKGNTSSQELMRVLRDAPAIKPDVIVSLSGICDIGFLLNAPNHPHLHKYAKRMLEFLEEAGLVTRRVFHGPPETISPAEVWCRNQRFAKVLADEQGITLLTCLQPVQGYGVYPQTDEEKAFFAEKAKVVLKGSNMLYGDAVTAFYEGVFDIMSKRPDAFDHVIDLTAALDDCPGAYKDHRHQNPLGVTHLAKTITAHVERALLREDQK